MANGDTQDIAATAIAVEYDRPIAVSVVSKLSKFPFLQKLAFNGQLSELKENFLGLEDFGDEMELYSSSSALLKAAWTLIKARVPLNLDVARNIVVSPTLGPVGNLFEMMVGFDQVFAVDPDQLSSSPAGDVLADK